MSFTDQKQRIAVKEDLNGGWYGGKLGEYFRCRLCGYKFKEGDKWRWVFTQNCDNSGVQGNAIICEKCDDTNENIIKKLIDNYKEFMQDKFWFWR